MPSNFKATASELDSQAILQAELAKEMQTLAALQTNWQSVLPSTTTQAQVRDAISRKTADIDSIKRELSKSSRSGSKSSSKVSGPAVVFTPQVQAPPEASGFVGNDPNIAALNASLGAISSKLAAGYAGINSAVNLKAATAQQYVQNQEMAAELKAVNDQVVVGVQDSLGLSPGTQSYLIAEALSRADSLDRQRRAVRDEYDQLAAMDPAQDLLGYVFTRGQANALSVQNNRLVAERDREIQSVVERQGIFSTFKRDYVSREIMAQKDLSVAEAKRNRDLANAQYQEELNKNSIAAAMDDLRILQTNLSVSQSSDASEARADRALARRTAAEQKAEADKDLARRNEALAIGSRLLGNSTMMTVDQMKDIRDPQLRAFWNSFEQSGALGATTGEAVENYLRFRTPLTTDRDAPETVRTAKAIQKQLQERMEVRLRSQNNPAFSGKKQSASELLAEESDQWVNEIYASTTATGGPDSNMASNKWATRWHPFRVMHRSQLNLLKDSSPLKPHLKALLAAKEELEPADEGVLLGALASDVAAGKLSKEVASKAFVDYMKAGVQANIETSRMSQLFGLKAPSTYAYTLESWLGDSKLDFFSVASVENYMVRHAVNERRTNSILKNTPYEMGVRLGGAISDLAK